MGLEADGGILEVCCGRGVEYAIVGMRRRVRSG